MRAGRPTKESGRVGTARMKTMTKAVDLPEAIINDYAYRKQLLVRARSGTLPANIEAMLWYYVLGKPTEYVHLVSEDKRKDASELSPSQMRKELDRMRKLGESLIARKQAEKDKLN